MSFAHHKNKKTDLQNYWLKNESHPILDRVKPNRLFLKIILEINLNMAYLLLSLYIILTYYKIVKMTNLLSNWKSVSDKSGGMDFEIEVLMVNKLLCNIGIVTGILKS